MGAHPGSLNWNPIERVSFSNTDHIMENQENGQTDRVTKLVRVLHPLRVEEIDEVKED